MWFTEAWDDSVHSSSSAEEKTQWLTNTAQSWNTEWCTGNMSRCIGRGEKQNTSQDTFFNHTSSAHNCLTLNPFNSWVSEIDSSVSAFGHIHCCQKGNSFKSRTELQTFVEIDHEIFSTVILSLPLIQEGQLSVSGERMCTILVNRLED